MGARAFPFMRTLTVASPSRAGVGPACIPTDPAPSEPGRWCPSSPGGQRGGHSRSSTRKDRAGSDVIAYVFSHPGQTLFRVCLKLLFNF